MNTPAKPISVLTPVSLALERTKLILFRPFDLSRWFVIGFCAWLATLGEGGGSGGGGNWPVGNRDRGNVREGFEQAFEYLKDNLYWILPVAIVVALVIVLVILLVLWLSSRGRFMFLHNVATNRAEVVAPWNAYRAHGNSLFLFRLALTVLGFCIIVPFVVAAVWAIVNMIRAEEPRLGGILAASFAILAVVIAGIILAVVEKFTKDFVLPIMRLRTSSCVAAWREFLRLLSANPGHFAVYILFHILLSIAIGIGLVAVIIVTCCLAGCLMAIPYLGAVFILPVHVFVRAYSLHYLAQFGSDFDVFPTSESIPPPSGTIPPPPASPAPDVVVPA